jgi:hypothetical protein
MTMNHRILVRLAAGLLAASVLVLGCTDAPTEAAPAYTVGGTVSGLTGSGLVLRDNGGDDLGVTANGPFTFTTHLAAAAAYSVTVYAQPSSPAQTCVAANGSGTMPAGDITTVAVACTTDGPPAPTPFVVSSPVPLPPSAAAGVARAGSANATVVYVSLPPGAISDGRTATLQDGRVGSGASATIVDGGFDPVPLVANVGDTLAIHVQVGGGAGIVSYTCVVPEDAPPIVVRTSPPPHKRDVPLNASMVVVFSQPINPATLTTGSVQLWQSATPVAGSVQLSDAFGLRAEFRPDALLAGNTDYRLVVSQSITDASGHPLDSAVTVTFTTGTQAPLFSIGGTVSGLMGAGLVLRLSTGENLPVTGDGPITFATTLASGAAYSVTVATLPSSPAQLCVVAGGAGNVESANVTDIAISCSGPDPLLMGQILFTAGTTRSHIMLLDLDRATITQLTNTSADDRYPQWSPDRSRIAFLRSAAATGGTAGLWVMNADGSGAHQISSPIFATVMTFCWSPDGTKLAIMGPDFFGTVNSNGSGLVTLQDSLPGVSGWGTPEWSPDGSTIAFVAMPADAYDWFAEVFLMDVDGSNVRRLTSANTYGGLEPFESSPVWSPDGTKVAYWSAMLGITVVNPDGTGANSATHDYFNPYTGVGVLPGNASPDWSPDGAHLVYITQSQLFVTAADGSGTPRQLTSVPGGVYDVAWFK